MADLAALKAEAEATFRDTGMRWADSRRATPGVERFVDRIGSFLILVGLAGLAVGGVGVSAAVRAYLEGKVATIATLKTLGAEGRMIFRIYLLQIGILAAVGVAAGLVLGAGVPLPFRPLIEAALPFPVNFALYPRPLAEAAFYGVMTAFLFTLWPLARTEGVRAAALYRGAGRRGLAALAALGCPCGAGACCWSARPFGFRGHGFWRSGRRGASSRRCWFWRSRPLVCGGWRGGWRGEPGHVGARRCGWRWGRLVGRANRRPR